MYLINPPLVTAIGRIFRRNTKHLRCRAGNNFNAFGNKANTIVKNENTRRLRFGLLQAVLGWVIQGLMILAAIGILLVAGG
jgi:hypothetical protein